MSRASGSRTWWQDEPARLTRELAAMEQSAPGLVWHDDEVPGGGWTGPVPMWPFARPAPAGLSDLLPAELEVRIECGHAFPMLPPMVFTINADIPVLALGLSQWHVAPNQSLCLLQSTSAWDPSWSAADMIPKIAGWFVEFGLLRAGRITEMTEVGIVDDATLDLLVSRQEGRP